MFCYQCQEAARGTGCTIQGVCGKLPETAKFQDLLLHTIKSIAFFSKKLRASGAVTIETDFYITNSLFMTITNANFDDDAIIEVIKKGLKLRENTSWNYSYFPVVFESEEQLLKVQKVLNENDIFPRRYFYPSLNTIQYVEGKEMPISESIASRIICLPLYVGLSTNELEQIVSIINISI